MDPKINIYTKTIMQTLNMFAMLKLVYGTQGRKGEEKRMI
jgi:hypothetical protein